MSDDEQMFVFDKSELVQTTSQLLIDGHLAVADSWLVEDGRVRNLNEHYKRFEAWATDLVERTDFETFFKSVSEQIPAEGRWFPRIELLLNSATLENQLIFRLREAPDQIDSMTLWSYTEPDPRINPLVKGPDLSLGLQMRRAAQMHGADEAVILNTDGFILEGALSALVWFRDDVLCAPGNDLAWIPSITRMEVFAIAEQMGLATRTEKVKPADLVDLEIWGLSSLHGIRPVAEWVDLGGPVGPARHLEAFSKRLRMLSTSIDV